MDLVTSPEGSVFCSLLLGGAAAHGICYLLSKKEERDFELVGQVSSIYLYPIKSCAGLFLSEADLSPRGAVINGVTDRHFMVTTSDYNFMSQRKLPKMALIVPSIHGPDLHIDAPDMETLIVPKRFPLSKGKVVSCSVWGKDCAGIDCGDEAANWFNNFLKRDDLRFVFYEKSLERRPVRGVEDESVGYPDSSPFMIANRESLEEVSGKLTQKIDMRNFRPNIVVNGNKGPWAEDKWEEVKICDAKLKYHKPCTRCKLTTVDPEIGEFNENSEPLKTLRSYRTIAPGDPSPVFGTNMYLIKGGHIHVGADVYAKRKTNPTY